MANVIRLKRASGSDPAASDLVSGEPAVRTDTGELFFKKDDGSIAKVAGAGGGPDFKYLALRNAANNGAASFPNADFTLVTSGTTSAITPTAANTLLVSVNGVIQKPNTGTSTPSQGFALSGSTIKFGANISAAPDFILYQESGGIGEPSDDTVSEVKLKVSNSPVNGYFLSAQSGNNGGLTWAAPVATSCTGNSATATALETARTINGTSFDGTGNITVTAAAGTLTGTTLNSSVVTSSLTSLGDLAGLTVVGNVALDNATNAGRDVQWQHANDRLAFFDNTKATFGNGADLQIYHDGSNSYVQDSGTGNLIIAGSAVNILNAAANESMIRATENGAVELYHDNVKRFETLSGGAKVTGHFLVTGSIAMDDNVKLKLGTSDDLEIYHDGANSLIDDAGTGILGIRSENGINFYKRSNNEFMLKAIPDGAVELYYNNEKVFYTRGDGVQVQNVNGDGVLYVVGSEGNEAIVKLHADDGDDNADKFQIVSHADNYFAIQNFASGSFENNLKAFGNGAVELYYDNAKKFETTAGGSKVTGNFIVNSGHISIDVDNKKLLLGASDDLQIYHDGNSKIQNTNNSCDLRIQSDSIELKANSVDEMIIKGVANGAVELYYDNVRKLRTTSGGITFEATDAGGSEHFGRFYFKQESGTVRGLFDPAAQKFSIYDNSQFTVGNSHDSTWFHDGSNTFLANNTGNLYIQNDGTSTSEEIHIRAKGGENSIKAIADGAVELYHNNSKKFETTSSGINVTGAITVNGSALTGGKVIQQVSATKTDTASNSTGSQSTWEFNDSSLRVQITGSSTSNKFLFLGQVTVGGEIATHIGLRDGEDSSNVTGMMGTNTSNRRASTSGKTHGDTHAANTVPIVGLISVPDTNQHTYYYQFSHTSGGTQTIYINTGSNTGNNAERGRYISHLTVLEISA